MKWLGTGFGLVTLQTFDILCTYQLGEELEALLPVQVKLHFSVKHSRNRLLVVQEKREGGETKCKQIQTQSIYYYFIILILVY